MPAQPRVQRLVWHALRAPCSGVKHSNGTRVLLQDIVEFVFFPVVNEGCRVIDEGECVVYCLGFVFCGRQRPSC